MTFLRRRRWTLVVVVLQVAFFIFVAVHQHRQWKASLAEVKVSTSHMTTEPFGCIILHTVPVSPEVAKQITPQSLWGDGADCWNPPLVEIVGLLDLPVVYLTAFLVIELGPYVSQLKLFWILTSVGIAIYWYGIGVLTGRTVDRLRRQRTPSS